MTSDTVQAWTVLVCMAVVFVILALEALLGG